VAAAEAVFEAELTKVPSSEQLIPNRVFLFSGHMIDRESRAEPRFPAERKRSRQQRSRRNWTNSGLQLEISHFCGGACGGDLIFARACLDRGVGLRVRIPFTEPMLLNESGRFAGEYWVRKYYEVKQDSRSTVLEMPEVLGPLPKGADPYARNNLWQLYAPLAWGAVGQ